MIFACGLSSYDVGIFHLSNHAFFKALLFLGAGSVIHAIADEQDMRKMGGLKEILPFSYHIILIGSLALMGIPFLTGFYSKDTILEVAYAKYTVFGHFAYYLGTFAAFFTAFYSLRLLFLVFLAEPNGNRFTLLGAHEASWRMGFPLFFLSLLSISIGFLTRDLFIGFGTNFWGASIFLLPQNYVLSDIEFIDLFYKLLPLIFTLSGAFFSFFLYRSCLQPFYQLKKTRIFKMIYNFLSKKWYFDRIYNEFIGQAMFTLSYQYSYKNIDRGIIENLGPFRIVNNIKFIFTSLTSLQSGIIYHYLFLFFLSLTFFAFVLIFFGPLFVSGNLIFFLIIMTIVLGPVNIYESFSFIFDSFFDIKKN
jgi:NADH-ubiquinone oxidoreductase chain 5